MYYGEISFMVKRFRACFGNSSSKSPENINVFNWLHAAYKFGHCRSTVPVRVRPNLSKTAFRALKLVKSIEKKRIRYG